MKKQLFEYSVIFHNFEDTEEGNRKYIDSVIVKPPTVELARSEGDLLFKVTREIPAEYADRPNDVEISIRNF